MVAGCRRCAVTGHRAAARGGAGEDRRLCLCPPVHCHLHGTAISGTPSFRSLPPPARLLSAGAALIDTDLKRIIAFSTISQIAFIFLGLSVGSEIGIAGGLLYILMHGMAKGGLFLCAGIVEQNTHTKDIRKLGGLIQTMPLTAIAFLLCCFFGDGPSAVRRILQQVHGDHRCSGRRTNSGLPLPSSSALS